MGLVFFFPVKQLMAVRAEYAKGKELVSETVDSCKEMELDALAVLDSEGGNPEIKYVLCELWN